MSEAIGRIDQNMLFEEYRRSKKIAPKRGENPKLEIFPSKHKGILPSKDGDFERHLEGALWNQCLVGIMPQSHDGEFRLLDYQFPLYEQQSDQIGKVDLVGVSSGRGNFAVIELKVTDEKGRVNDSPLSALIQALGYTAIIVENMRFIKVAVAMKQKENQKDERWNLPSIAEKPSIILLAPDNWWFENDRNNDGNWKGKFKELLNGIKENLGIETHCFTLGDISKVDIGWKTEMCGYKPEFHSVITFSDLHIR